VGGLALNIEFLFMVSSHAKKCSLAAVCVPNHKFEVEYLGCKHILMLLCHRDALQGIHYMAKRVVITTELAKLIITAIAGAREGPNIPDSAAQTFSDINCTPEVKPAAHRSKRRTREQGKERIELLICVSPF
jgi:hypothetical protein